LHFTLHTLEPFKFDDILEAALLLVEGAVQDTVEPFAAHILYITGGHPDCMVKVFKLYSQYIEVGSSPQDFFQKYADMIWNEHVRDELIAIENEIPGDLRPIFETMSFYRYFDKHIVETLMEAGELPTRDVLHLLDSMTSTHLIERIPYMYRDAITRRLIVLSLRHRLPAPEFSRRCTQAFNLYLSALKKHKDDRREVWAIECFFQLLQAHAVTVQEGKARPDFLERPFGKELDRILKAYVGKRREYRSAIEAVLYKMDEDWELQFIVDYFFGENGYSLNPYEKLKSAIDSWVRK